MLASIITPTHDSTYLLEAYRSLLRQGDAAFEWIIVPNAKYGEPLPQLPPEILQDPRTLVVPYRFTEPPKVGALKNFACSQAHGDVLVELDHDDELTPGVLIDVLAALAEGGDFIYSDAAHYLDGEQREPVTFQSDWGWEHYEYELDGKHYLPAIAFDVTPRSLCEIFYAPDHVRCWRHSFYDSIGGHDRDLLVADDHDLICRSYLAGGKFTRLDRCGYLYRRYSNELRQNTVITYNQEIQEQQRKNRARYLHSLIGEWCRREKLGYLDLAAEGVLAGLQEPSLANTVGCIRAYGDLFSRLSISELVPLLNRVYQALVPGGWLCVETPSTAGPAAFLPHYRSYHNAMTFESYTNRNLALYLHEYRSRFQLVQMMQTKRQLVGSSSESEHIYADLSALKGQRQPGPQLI